MYNNIISPTLNDLIIIQLISFLSKTYFYFNSHKFKIKNFKISSIFSAFSGIDFFSLFSSSNQQTLQYLIL